MSEGLYPLQIYNEAAPGLQALSLELLLAEQEAAAAQAGEVRSSTRIQAASAAVRAATARADTRVHEVLDQIYASPDFPKSTVLEGLHAVAWTKGMGGLRAAHFVEGSTHLQSEMQVDGPPLVMAVVGGPSTLVCGIADRKAGIGARRADRNLMMNVSLLGVHRSMAPEDDHADREKRGAMYRTGERGASQIEVNQEPHQMWVTGSTDEVEEAISEATRIKRNTASNTALLAIGLIGIMPIVAYRPEPVAAVLGQAARYVPENNGPSLWAAHLLATGVNIGLSQSVVASIRPDLNPSSVLRSSLIRGIGELVADRFDVAGGFFKKQDVVSRGLRPATTTSVMRFVGIEAEEMQGIVGDILSRLFLRANHEKPAQKKEVATSIAGLLGEVFSDLKLFNAEGLMAAAGSSKPSGESFGPYL